MSVLGRCLPTRERELFFQCPMRYETALFLAENDPWAVNWMQLWNCPNFEDIVDEPDYSFLSELGFEGEDFKRCVVYIKEAMGSYEDDEDDKEERKTTPPVLCLYVLFLSSTQVIHLYINETETVYTLKEKICMVAGIPLANQRLKSRGEFLEEEGLTLAAYQVQYVQHIDFYPSGSIPFVLFVKTLDGGTLALDVKTFDDVEQVRELIFLQLGATHRCSASSITAGSSSMTIT